MASSIDFVAGCVGGAVGVVIGHPFDTIKVIMQTSSQRISIMSIMKKSSIPSLYKGINAPLSGLTGINAIVFGVHGTIMRFCPNENQNQRYLWNGIAGAISGFAQSFITCPMELVKTRAQLTKMPVIDCMKQVFRLEGGSRALYRGLGITLARDCPAFATYFYSYEYLLNRLKPKHREYPSTWNMLLAGGTAGALSWLVIYPVDVIKSRIQADIQYRSIRHCVQDAVQKEGLSVLMRGCSPTLIRAFPTNAATFAVVTWTLVMYETHLNRQRSSLPESTKSPAGALSTREILD